MSTSDQEQNNKSKLSWTLIAIFVLAIIVVESFALGRATRQSPGDAVEAYTQVSDNEVETETQEQTQTESGVASYIVDNTGNETITEMSIDIGSTLVQVKVPKDHVCYNKEYLTQLSTQYSIGELNIDNLLVTGNAGIGKSLFESTEIVIASPISTTKEIFKSIYGDEYNEDFVYSAVYSYMISGEVPDTGRDDYNIEELDLLGNGLIWRVFEESYTQQLDDETSVEVQNLYAYSQTENFVEIIISAGDMDRAYTLLKEVINAK